MTDVLADTEAYGPVYAAIAHVWGERCSDYEPGCPCCDAWAEYDRLGNASAENEKRAKDGHDVYAAAREEYRKKIAEQADEIEKLRAAIERAIRQHEEGNKGMAHRTLCEAVYGAQA